MGNSNEATGSIKETVLSLEKQGWCKARCNAGTTAHLHRRIMENGSEHFCWVCAACGGYDPFRDSGVFIPKAKVIAFLSEAQIESLPIIMPNSSTRCVVCGSRQTELHHWSPRGISGDECERWPKDYLCVPCHQLWHRKVTPQLVKEILK